MATKRPKVLFVTNELYPYDKGGIGRFIYNYGVWNEAQNSSTADLHVLYDRRTKSSSKWGEDDNSGLTVHFSHDLELLSVGQNEKIASESAVMENLIHESDLLAHWIKALVEKLGEPFDYIEFPDFMGWALCTIRRKLGGEEWLSRSKIVVRLHSSMTAIQADEGIYHNPSFWFSGVSDVERYCLSRADLVVGHIPSIIEHNSRIFGFDKPWQQKTHHEFPPVELAKQEYSIDTDEECLLSDAGKLFVFCSRYQPFKRPELFIEAALEYMNKNSRTNAQFILTSYGWDKEYIEHLNSLIPSEMSKNIQLRNNESIEARKSIVEAGCTVIPSSYESFCLLAYESYLSGRKLILNSACPAFGKNKFWKDGENCVLFDGTHQGLASAFERVGKFKQMTNRRLPKTTPYWQATQNNTSKRPNKSKPSVDLFVVAEGGDLVNAQECARSFIDSNTIDIAHVIVPNVVSGQALNSPNMISHSVSRQLNSLELKKAIQHSKSDYVFIVNQNCRPTDDWIKSFDQMLRQGDVRATGFPVRKLSSNDNAKLQFPVYDAPNVANSGFLTRLFPLMISRQSVLDILENKVQHDYCFLQLIIEYILHNGAIDVVPFPLNDINSVTSDAQLTRKVAFVRSIVQRLKTPHLAAYNVKYYKPEKLTDKMPERLDSMNFQASRFLSKLGRRIFSNNR